MGFVIQVICLVLFSFTIFAGEEEMKNTVRGL